MNKKKNDLIRVRVKKVSLTLYEVTLERSVSHIIFPYMSPSSILSEWSTQVDLEILVLEVVTV